MYFKSITILLFFFFGICEGYSQKEPPQGGINKGISFTDTTKASENVLLQYADSINRISVIKKVPDFLFYECIDQVPPLFVGFHGSFRWMVLQRVTNLSALKYLIDSQSPVRENLVTR